MNRLGTVFLLGLSLQGVKAFAGRIVAGHDINTLSSSLADANEEQFAVNLATWLSGGTSGSILVIESTPGDVTRDYSAGVRTALDAAGFTVTYISSPAVVSALTLADLTAYDIVFAGVTHPTLTFPSASALTAYINGGGGVYVFGGVNLISAPAPEAALLNPFLSGFGLAFVSAYNSLQPTITSTHPIFAGITGTVLEAGNGQSIISLGTNPMAGIVQFSGGEGVYAVVDQPNVDPNVVPEPATAIPVLIGITLAVLNRGRQRGPNRLHSQP